MEFVELLKEADLLDFGQNFKIARPELSGDRLFPDQKTQNITAKYLAMSDSAYLPTMATVHALDAEAQIGSRPTASIVTVEKLLIKRKINLSERVRLLRNHGVNTNNEILDYIFDDMARLAEGVKTRTEVAKQELLATGKMTINENHVNTTIDFGVPTDHTNKAFDWSTEAKAKTILDDIQGVRDAAIATGSGVCHWVMVMYWFCDAAVNAPCASSSGVTPHRPAPNEPFAMVARNAILFFGK